MENNCETIEFTDDLLCKKVYCFVHTKRMLNAKMRGCIDHNIPCIPCDEILQYCINKGWADAIQYEKFNKSSKILQNAGAIKEKLKCAINNYDKSTTGFNAWHNSLCSSVEYMRYGVWQKFINMTFKYLYCFKEVLEKDKISSIPWDDLHCPIDSVIAKKVLCLMSKYGFEDEDKIIESISLNGIYNVSWNNICQEKYLHVQRIIAELCKKEGLPSKLSFDFLHWER